MALSTLFHFAAHRVLDLVELLVVRDAVPRVPALAAGDPEEAQAGLSG